MPKTLVAAALALLLLSAGGCRENPLGVSPSAPQVGWIAPILGPGATDSPPAPPIRAVVARATSGTLEFAAIYDRRRGEPLPAFDPAHPGGWCFQLFVDADRLPTGYGPGYDYIVRGIERTPEGGFYLRRSEAGTGPGGWGEAVGEIAVRFANNRLSLTIPLDVLGSNSGRVDYSLELYATVSADDSSGGVYHVFVANYSGTSGPNPLAPLLGQQLLAVFADRR